MNKTHTSDILKLPFPLEEFSRRRNLVLEAMRESRLDAIVITSVANIYYTTGLPNVFPLGLFALVLRSDGEGFWIGRRIELSNAHSIVAVTGWSQVGRAINDEEDPYDAFAEGLLSLVEREARIGFEMDSRSFPPALVDRIASATGVAIVNSSGLVESLRAVKTKDEIAYLRASGVMTAEMMRAAIGAIKVGARDSDVAAAAYLAGIKLGTDPLPTPPLVTAGPRSALAHTTFDFQPLKRGELIGIELTSAVARYCTPCFRIATIGQARDELRRYHDASRDASLAAKDKLRPGMTSHEADLIVRASLEKAGYLEWFPVRAGYSIGLGFVPSWDEDHIMKLRPNDDRVLKPGMAFHVVPALYKSGVGVACCSNSLLITETGAEPLVPIEAELMIVD